MADTLKSRVNRLVKKWRKVLGLGSEWRIVVIISGGDPEAGDGAYEHVNVAAHTAVEPGYFAARITVNSKCFDGEHHVDLEQVIVHELCHVLLRPVESLVEAVMPKKLADVVDQNMEALCERVSRALVRLDRA